MLVLLLVGDVSFKSLSVLWAVLWNVRCTYSVKCAICEVQSIWDVQCAAGVQVFDFRF